MMYRKLNSVDEIPTGDLTDLMRQSKTIVKYSECLYLLTRDDGSNVGILGIYRHSVMSPIPLLWFARYGKLRFHDWPHLRELFNRLMKILPSVGAMIDETDNQAVTFVKHLGFKRTQEGIFQW